MNASGNQCKQDTLSERAAMAAMLNPPHPDKGSPAKKKVSRSGGGASRSGGGAPRSGGGASWHNLAKSAQLMLFTILRATLGDEPWTHAVEAGADGFCWIYSVMLSAGRYEVNDKRTRNLICRQTRLKMARVARATPAITRDIQGFIDSGVFQITAAPDRKDIRTVEDYLDRLTDDRIKMFGYELELSLLSIVFDAPVIVLHHAGIENDTVVTGRNYIPSQTLKNRPIVIWYLGGHYQAICPATIPDWETQLWNLPSLFSASPSVPTDTPSVSTLPAPAESLVVPAVSEIDRARRKYMELKIARVRADGIFSHLLHTSQLRELTDAEKARKKMLETLTFPIHQKRKDELLAILAPHDLKELQRQKDDADREATIIQNELVNTGSIDASSESRLEYLSEVILLLRKEIKELKGVVAKLGLASS